jgi:hypothetical protein
MPTVIWGENASRRDRTKLKRVSLLIGGIVTATIAFSLLIARVFANPLPREWSDNTREEVRYAFTDPAQDAYIYRYINLEGDPTEMKNELMRSGGWEAEPLKDPQVGGWFLRSLDPQSPFLNIQLDVGRYHSGKSPYYYDHPDTAGWSEGWTAAMVTYRPNVTTRVERFAKEILPQKAGRKPPPAVWTVVIRESDRVWRESLATSHSRNRSQKKSVE